MVTYIAGKKSKESSDVKLLTFKHTLTTDHII